MTAGHGPRVRGNDWSVLDDPAVGSWTPQRSASIVIPAYRASRTLPYTLAALRAQTYPAHLLEVIVVDDDAGSSLELPELRPENTRLVRSTASWGRASACGEGAAVAEGDVIHWLDADMVPSRDEVARQLRWHHVIDHAVVLGHKCFVEVETLPPVPDVLAAIESDRLGALFADFWSEEHTWVEAIWRRTADLTQAGFRAFHVHVGATASVGRDLYHESGGMDPSLKLGEDIELGYRLAMRGAVFVGDREARNWHLGRSTLMRQEQLVQRYNQPFIAERVPDLRKFRQDRGRAYRVPLVQVVVDTAGHTYETVKYTVDGVLQAVPGDVECCLLGRWSDLHEERRQPLDDPLVDMRLVREEYASDGRVSFAEALDRTAFPAMFRFHLPAGWRSGRNTLDQLTRDMQKRAIGLRSVHFPDGRIGRLERTAAFERAHRVRQADEDLDDVVDQLSVTWWSEAVEDGFLRPGLAPPSPQHQRASGPTGGRPSPVPDSEPVEEEFLSSPWRSKVRRLLPGSRQPAKRGSRP